MAQKYDPENKEYDSYRRETEFKYLEVEGVRSKELPAGCSPEAIAKQAKLRSENMGFRRLQVIEEDLEEIVDNRKDVSKETNDVDSVQESRIVELPDDLPESNNQPKIVELPDDYEENEQNGANTNEIFDVKELDDDFKTIKICEIIDDDDDEEEEDDNVVVEEQTVVQNHVEEEVIIVRMTLFYIVANLYKCSNFQGQIICLSLKILQESMSKIIPCQ